MTQLLPADIVMVRGYSWISRAIRWRTRRRREAPTVINHVGIVVGPGSIVTAPVVEAMWSGVLRRTLIEGYAGKPDEVAIFRAKNLTDNERDRIAMRADEYVGRGYGWAKIALHLIGLRGLSVVDRWPICSWVVAKAYAAEGYSFGLVDASRATPDDLWDYCVSRPDRYRVVRLLRAV